MTNQHLSREQLEKYRGRILAPGELSAIDSHLGRCGECRDQLAALAPAAAAVSLISSVREARSEHLTYEQMDAWVEDELDQTERELIVAHVGLCASCAHQLRTYEQAAPAMSAPVVAVAPGPRVEPAKLASVSWGERLRAFVLTPQTAIAVAALLTVVILAPYLAQRQGSSGERTSISTGTDQLDSSSLDTLPEALRNGARALLSSEAAQVPAVLGSLTLPQGADLQYPRWESVEETQPTLRWMAFSGSYDVAVLDAQGAVVARTEGLNGTEWPVPVALLRGASYTWQVTADGRTESASFRVLDEAQAGLLMDVRGSHRGSHLALGAVAFQLGLLRDAEREFDALAQEYPASASAARLLRSVRTLRGK